MGEKNFGNCEAGFIESYKKWQSQTTLAAYGAQASMRWV